MAKLNDAAAKVAEIIADYRSGEVPTPDNQHVLKWVSQFSESVRLPILEELSHVLSHTYLSKADAKKFLRGVAQTQDLVGENPCEFLVQGEHYGPAASWEQPDRGAGTVR